MNEMLVYLEKLGLAIVLSGLIGYERERQHKPAGLRTSILVTLAATMIMLFSEIMVKRGLTMDAVRAPSYMMTGLGFLGAGIIMSRGGKVEGITTAAILLVLVPIGLLIGIGEYELAICSSIVTYLVLKLKHIEKLFEKNDEKNLYNHSRGKVHKRRVVK